MNDVGFVGYGEVGYQFSIGFRRSGLSMAAYVRSPAKVAARADEVGVTLVNTLEELVTSSRLVLSCVWPDSALAVASECARFLKPGQTFVDFNSVSPMTTAEIGEAIADSGADFVKLAIMAAIPDYGFEVPLLAGGETAVELAERLNGYGMKVRAVGTDPQQPAAIKILRSIGLKGLVTLVYEMLLVSRKYGVEEEVLSSASEILDAKPFKTTVNGWISSTAIHAKRRADEMDEAIETALAVGIRPVMSEAAKSVYKDIAGYHLKEVFGSEIPSSYIEVLHRIEALEGKKGGS